MRKAYSQRMRIALDEAEQEIAKLKEAVESKSRTDSMASEYRELISAELENTSLELKQAQQNLRIREEFEKDVFGKVLTDEERGYVQENMRQKHINEDLSKIEEAYLRGEDIGSTPDSVSERENLEEYIKAEQLYRTRIDPDFPF